MKIFLGADHRGFQLKEKIKTFLEKEKVPFEDLGNFVFDRNDDYPDFALKVAKKVAENKNSRGILICGSGEGMAMVANKIKGVRAATAFNVSQARALREKNNINILALASDWLNEKETKKIVRVFLKTKFSGIYRHQRRIEKIKKIERSETPPSVRKIIPAILTNKISDLKNKLKKIEGLTDWVQIDIMDGKFVKNTSIKLSDLKEIKIPFNLEIHLMVFNPEKYFPECQRLKAKRVIFHQEAVKDSSKILKEMEKYSFEKGIALNPETGVKKIKSYLKYLDLVLLLGVTPGFQGQRFNQIVLKKIKELRKISKKIKIGVNGGVNIFNIEKLARLGVDNLVVGSYLFQSKDINLTFKELKSKI